MAIFIGSFLVSSSDRVGAAQAFDHRYTQEIGAKLGAIGGDGAQLGVEFLALARVLLLDIALVLDGLALEIFLRHRAALTVIEIESIVARAVLDDRRELVGEIEGVVEAEIHAHAAQRIVDVRGIAGEEEAAVTIA